MESIKRIPPYSLGAEQSVLGAMIIDQEAIIVANSIICSDDFYQPDYKILFECLTHLYRNNKPIDLIVIQEYLQVNGKLEQIGGIEYISKIAMAVPTSVHAKDYAQIIKEKSYLRKAIQYANEVSAAAYNQEYSATITTMANTPQMANKNEHKSVCKIFEDGLNDVAMRYKAEDDIRGIRTGYIDLDRLTGGMKPGEIIGLTADPNVGKSILAMNIAMSVAKRNKETAFFAYEMTTTQLAYRLMPGELNININTLSNPKGNLDGTDFMKIKNYETNKINNLNIYAEDLEQKTVAEIEGRVRLHDNLGIIVVDYLQLLKYEGQVDHKWEAYTENVRLLKEIARKYNVPVLIILSKAKDGTLRGSADLEFDFDHIWELKRKDKDSSDKAERQKTDLLVTKCRDGRIGKVNLLYTEDYLLFKSRAKEDANREYRLWDNQ